MDSVLLSGKKNLSVCWKTQGKRGRVWDLKNCNFSDVTQSQSNVQNFVISHSILANKVSIQT